MSIATATDMIAIEKVAVLRRHPLRLIFAQSMAESRLAVGAIGQLVKVALKAPGVAQLPDAVSSRSLGGAQT
jgi:hypothetical protein